MSSQISLSQRFAAWLRREQVWGFFLSVAVIAVIATAFFYPDASEGRTLAQYDMVQGTANSHESQLYEEATGEKALWTDALFSGMPTFQIDPTYPTNDLFSWINAVYGLGLPVPSNLLAMMMIGMLILCFALGLRWYYALIGAVAWGFSSYFVIIIGAGHIWKFVALAYIPPTIAGLVLCYRRRYLGGAALTALFAMMQLNANHPQMTYYFGWVMAALVVGYLVQAVMQRRVAAWCAATAIVIGAGLLAVGANLPSLYHTYEYAKETKRAGSELKQLSGERRVESGEDFSVKSTGGMPYDQITGWCYTPSETWSLLIPNVKGGASAVIENGQTVAATLDKVPAAADATMADPNAGYLLSQLPQYFNDTEGTNGPVYAGAVIVALFLLGLIIVRGPVKWVLLVMTVVSIVLAWGRHWAGPTDWMIWHMPLYNKFRAVESILVIAEFCMPLLGVMALKEFFTGDGPSKYRRAACIAFGIPALVCLVGAVAPSVFGSALTAQESEVLKANAPQYYEIVEDIRLGLVSGDCWRSLMFVVAAGALMIGFTVWVRQRMMLLAGVGLLILCDLYSADKRYLSSSSFTSPEMQMYDPLAADQADQAIMADAKARGLKHYRVMDVPGFQSPNRSYHHSMIGGYHAAKLSRYDDLIATGAIGTPGVINMLNGQYVITGEGLMPNPGALGPAWLVPAVKYVDGADAEMAALKTLAPDSLAVADRSFQKVLGTDCAPLSTGDTITLKEYTPNRLTYHASAKAPALAVFSEIYFPWGWKASVDGKEAPIGRVNYVLRAMRLPAGEHEVVMTFDPESIHVTEGIAYACVIIIYLLCLTAAAMRMIPAKKTPEENVD